MSTNTKTQKQLAALATYLDTIEKDIQRAKAAVNALLDGDADGAEQSLSAAAAKLMSYTDENASKVIEWVYDGYFMLWSDDKKYPVPLNYASKSKLVPGDVLKLRIMADGKLIYKIIAEAEKKYLKATLSQNDDMKFIAHADNGKMYYLNHAAVTFFKGKAGDELSIITNANSDYDYAAIEAIIHTQ